MLHDLCIAVDNSSAAQSILPNYKPHPCVHQLLCWILFYSSSNNFTSSQTYLSYWLYLIFSILLLLKWYEEYSCSVEVNQAAVLFISWVPEGQCFYFSYLLYVIVWVGVKFNIIFKSVLTSLKWLFPWHCQTRFLHAFLFTVMSAVHLLLLRHILDQKCEVSCCELLPFAFFCHRAAYSPDHLVFKHTQSVFFRETKRSSFLPIWNAEQVRTFVFIQHLLAESPSTRGSYWPSNSWHWRKKTLLQHRTAYLRQRCRLV